jgi:hypothetical protein
MERALCRAPDSNFINELRASGIPFEIGGCIVDADATDAPTMLDVIRKLGLPLALIFNRNRVMVLPQGVSKATGLRENIEYTATVPPQLLGRRLWRCERSAAYAKQAIRDKHIEHKQYIAVNGEDMPEIRRLEMERPGGNSVDAFNGI